MAWTWPLMLHLSASVVVLWKALAVPRGARAYRRSGESGCSNGSVVLNSGGRGIMVWLRLLMLHGGATVLVLTRALTRTGGACACRRIGDSGGRGRMVGTLPGLPRRCVFVGNW